ncbi:MAG: prenyltransferase/squalene oxidase repeat-containing protein [Candidatus Ranarchaeia archaeon]
MRNTAKLFLLSFLSLIILSSIPLTLLNPDIIRQNTRKDYETISQGIETNIGPRMSRALEKLSKLQIGENVSNKGGFSPVLTSTIEDTYYAILSLDLLNDLDKINTTLLVSWYLQNFNNSLGTITNSHPSNRYDLTIISETSMSISTLNLMNKTNYVNQSAIIDYVRSCERSDGGFASSSDETIPDLSSTFYAIMILFSLDSLDIINTSKTVNFIKSKQHQDPDIPKKHGGFSDLSQISPTALSNYRALKSLEWLGNLTEINSTSFIEWINGTKRTDGFFSMKHSSSVEFNVIQATNLQLLNLEILNRLDLINTTELADKLLSLQRKDGGFPSTSNISTDLVPEVIDEYSAIQSLNILDSLNQSDINSISRWILGTFQPNGGASALSNLQGISYTTLSVLETFYHSLNTSQISSYIDTKTLESWLFSCIKNPQGSFTNSDTTILSSTIEFSPTTDGIYHLGIYHTSYALQCLDILGNLSLISTGEKDAIVTEVIQSQIINPETIGYGGFSIINRNTFILNRSMFANINTVSESLTILDLFDELDQIENNSILLDFLLKRYNEESGLFEDNNPSFPKSKLTNTLLAVDSLIKLQSLDLINTTKTQNEVLSYLDSQDLHEILDSILILKKINHTNPITVNTTQIIDKILSSQVSSGLIQSFPNSTYIDSIIITKKSMRFLNEFNSTSKWDIPLVTIPKLIEIPENSTLGGIIPLSVTVSTDLGGTLTNSTVTAELFDSSILVYNSTSKSYQGSFQIPNNISLLGIQEMRITASSNNMTPSHITSNITITSSIDYTLLNEPDGEVASTIGANLTLVTRLTNGILIQPNFNISSTPLTEYTLNNLGNSVYQIYFNLSKLSGNISLSVNVNLEFCQGANWNKSIVIKDDIFVIVEDSFNEEVTILDPSQYIFTITTIRNNTPQNITGNWQLYSKELNILTKDINLSSLTPNVVNVIFNSTGYFILKITLNEQENILGTTQNISIKVVKRILNNDITYHKVGYVTSKIQFTGYIKDKNISSLETYDFLMNITNGVNSYTFSIQTNSSGNWSLDWIIPEDTMSDEYMLLLTQVNGSIFDFNITINYKISIYYPLEVSIETSEKVVSKGENLIIIVRVFDHQDNDISGLIRIDLLDSSEKWIISTNTLTEIMIPYDSSYGLNFLILNITTNVSESLIMYHPIWIGKQSEMVLSTSINNEVRINEINNINLNIRDSNNIYLRTFNITLNIYINGSKQNIGTFFSDWIGDCEIEWSVSIIGEYTLSFEFNGKDQFSPVTKNLTITVTKIPTHFELEEYNFQLIGNEEFLIVRITLLTEHEDLVTNSSIYLHLQNSSIQLVTDYNGEITFSIPIENFTETITIALSYPGDEIRNSSDYGPHSIPLVNNISNIKTTQNSIILSATSVFGIIGIMIIIEKRKK